MSPYATEIAIIGVIALMVLIFAGMNIGMALLTVGFIGYASCLNWNWKAAFGVLRTVPSTQAGSYSTLVVPLFVLMGNFAYRAGLSSGLYQTGTKWLSRVPGSLACGTVAAGAGFGAICGSNTATCATMCTIALPEMRKAGYNDQLSTGSIAIGGALGILIPPSTPMILYAIMASCSVGSLFEAGILPGIMMATLSIITIVILCKINPDFAPSTQKCTWNERIKTLPGLIPVVLLFGIVMGGIFTGWFSVTQSAAVGAFVAMLLMALPKNLTIRTIIDALRECTRTFSMTFFIIIGASVFGNFLAITKMPMSLANLIAEANINRYVVIVLITLIYLFLGMIMDELPMIMLTVPIFLPVIQALGFDKIWFGIYIIMAMELGALSPPVGLNCFIINGIQKDISLATIYKGVLPFILTIFVAIALITAFPIIVTYLPTVLNQ